IRKQNQIDHAPVLSRKAGLIKYADKISNIRDIVDSPPVHWSAKRKLDYVTWGENVINNVRTRNASLEHYFDELIERTRKSIGNKDKGK
ncbi:MAG: phosphohydrolase, partial [Candidatus Latescibacteria bacterium]|nr:phosphohydrolase [Candidatus Latescibacterota bacterium]